MLAKEASQKGKKRTVKVPQKNRERTRKVPRKYNESTLKVARKVIESTYKRQRKSRQQTTKEQGNEAALAVAHRKVKTHRRPEQWVSVYIYAAYQNICNF